MIGQVVEGQTWCSVTKEVYRDYPTTFYFLKNDSSSWN